MDLKALGRLIKQQRVRLGLSAREVAVGAGITTAYLWMIESAHNPRTGKPSRPSADILARVARALRLNPEDIFALAGYHDVTLGLQGLDTGGFGQMAALMSNRREGASEPQRSTGSAPAPYDLALLPLPEPFFGRESELNWILQRLLSHELRGVVAIRGLGGLGKTALAAKVVRQLYADDRFPGGIAVALCHRLSDPVDVLRQVLSRFETAGSQAAETDIAGLSGRALALLRDRDALVVLDNIEPELSVTDVVLPLRLAGASLLLTARHLLPRAVVPADASLALGLLTEREGLNLFFQSRGSAPDEAPPATEEEVHAAQSIVRVLGRHTLAIRVAGAYAGDMQRDLRAFASDLKQHPQRAITLPQDDVPHAVQHVFQTSMAALPLEARRLFAGLAAFASNEFGYKATLALAKGLGIAAPEAAAYMLVHRALLTPTINERLADGCDRERLQLHVLVRVFIDDEFGRWPAEEQDAAHLALARHYANRDGVLPERAAGPDEINVLGALESATQLGHHDLVMQLCVRLGNHWRSCGRTTASRTYLPRGIAAGLALFDTESIPRERADYVDVNRIAALVPRLAGDTSAAAEAFFWLLLRYGNALQLIGRLDDAERFYRFCDELTGDEQSESSAARQAAVMVALGELGNQRCGWSEAQAFLERALAITHTLGDRRAEGVVRGLLARADLNAGNPDRAETTWNDALALSRAAEDQINESELLRRLSYVAQMRGELNVAEARLQESLEIAQAIGDLRGEGTSLAQLGRLARDRGDLDKADNLLNQAFALALEVNDRQCQGTIRRHQGRVARDRGEVDQAITRFNESLRIAREVQDRRGEGTTLAQLGRIERVRGQPVRARALLETARRIAETEVNDQHGLAIAVAELGLLAQTQGQLDEAEECYRRSLKICERIQDQRDIGRNLSRLGQIAEARGKFDDAERFYLESLAIHQNVQDRRGEGIDHIHLGQVARLRGRLEEAERYFMVALEIVYQVHDRRDEGVIQAQLGWIAQARGQLALARAHYQQSLTLRRDVRDRQGEGAVLGQLGWLAQAQGDLDVAEQYFQDALDISREVGDLQSEGSLLGQLGSVAVARSRLDKAEGYLADSLTILRQAQDRRGEGITLARLGQVAMRRNELAAARHYYEQALAIDCEVGDRRGEAIDRSRLGWIAQEQGNLGEADHAYGLSLAIRREVQDRRGEAIDLWHIGQIASARGQHHAALARYQEALLIAGEVLDTKTQRKILLGLASLANANGNGNLREVKAWYGRSQSLRQPDQNDPEMAHLLQDLGTALGERPTAHAQAVTVLREAVKVYEEQHMSHFRRAREAKARLKDLSSRAGK